MKECWKEVNLPVASVEDIENLLRGAGYMGKISFKRLVPKGGLPITAVTSGCFGEPQDVIVGIADGTYVADGKYGKHTVYVLGSRAADEYIPEIDMSGVTSLSPEFEITRDGFRVASFYTSGCKVCREE